MKRELTSVFVEVGRMEEAERIQVFRYLLNLVADVAQTFECDIPPLERGDEEFVSAGRVLLEAGRSARSTGVLPATGLLRVGDPEVWEAFVKFAPKALDGTVWDKHGVDIVSFADQGRVLYGRLTPEQRQLLADRVGVEQVRSSPERGA